MTTAAESQNIAIVLFVTAAAAGIILLARVLIRARFRRNMPHGYQRPEWPTGPPPKEEWKWLMRGEQAASPDEAAEKAARMPRGYPPTPIPIPPPPEECPIHGELPDGGPCRRCLEDQRQLIDFDPNAQEPTPEDAPKLAGDAISRAYEIRLMAERLFVAHPATDPEQVYRDAVRWVDSRVAVALAEYRDPGAVDQPDFPPGAAIIAGEPVAVGEDGKVRPIEGAEAKK